MSTANSTADRQGFENSTDYIQLFHRYITQSIEALNARLEIEVQEIATDLREQAWHLLDYALKLPKAWDGVCKLLLSLAPHMERAGFRHEWLPYLERGVAVSQQVQDVAGEAQLSLYIGRLYRLRGELPQAREWFETSARLSAQVGDKAGRAKALNQLAYVARLQSQYALTQTYVDEALSLLDEGDSERATSYWVLGTVAQHQLHWDEAEIQYRSALRIWQNVGDEQRVAWAFQNLGEALRGAKKYPEAIDNIQQAISLLGKIHDPVNQAIARMGLGIVYIYDANPKQALALFELAESVFRQVGDQLHLAMVCTNLIIVYRDIAHLQKAEDIGKIAIRLWNMLGDWKMLANAEDELGLVYLTQLKYAEAIETFESGLAHLKLLSPDPYWQMINNSLLAHLSELGYES